MPAMFDVTLILGKTLARDLGKLTDKTQRQILGRAMTKAANSLKNEVLRNLSGKVVKEVTGQTVTAFENTKIKSRFKLGKFLARLFPLPTRAELGIKKATKGKKDSFYPFAIEYGHAFPGRGGSGIKDVPAMSYIRSAVDDNKEREIRIIAQAVRKGIERQWKKMGRGIA